MWKYHTKDNILSSSSVTTTTTTTNYNVEDCDDLINANYDEIYDNDIDEIINRNENIKNVEGQ